MLTRLLFLFYLLSHDEHDRVGTASGARADATHTTSFDQCAYVGVMVDARWFSRTRAYRTPVDVASALAPDAVLMTPLEKLRQLHAIAKGIAELEAFMAWDGHCLDNLDTMLC